MLLATQAAYFLYLFGVFYYKQYVKNQKIAKQNENSAGKNKQLDDKEKEVSKNGKIPTEATMNGKSINSSAKKQKVK